MGWMRSRRMVRESDSQCRSRNCPGFDPQHPPTQWNLRGDDSVLNIVHKKKNYLTDDCGWDLAERGRYLPRCVWDLAECGWDLAEMRMRSIQVVDEIQPRCGWDLAECGCDLAECGWDLAEMRMRSIQVVDEIQPRCGWDLAECGCDLAETWMRSS
jgi:hypothetical protein